MLREKADELSLGPFGIGKIKFGVELLLGAQEIARAQTGAPDQLLYLCTRGRRLQVFDDFGSIPRSRSSASAFREVPQLGL